MLSQPMAGQAVVVRQITAVDAVPQLGDDGAPIRGRRGTKWGTAGRQMGDGIFIC